MSSTAAGSKRSITTDMPHPKNARSDAPKEVQSTIAQASAQHTLSMHLSQKIGCACALPDGLRNAPHQKENGLTAKT